MAGADDIFSAMRDPTLGREAQQRAQQEGFEETLVKKLLRYAGVELRVGLAKKMAWEDRKTNKLDFAWFTEQYPHFPIVLGAAKLKFTSGHHIGWTELMGKGFLRQPWIKEYEHLLATLECNPLVDRVALAFNAPHADQSYVMVLHNQPIQAQNVMDPEFREEPETRIIRPIGRPRMTYVLESFNSFMQTVGTEWAKG